MRPEYIGVGNFDTDNYVYAFCKCPLPTGYAIKWPRIKDGKFHRCSCTCEDCGTEVEVVYWGWTGEENEEEVHSNNRWCNTCEFKHLESECLGCAEYDEYDNLIELRNYKKEETK